MAENIRKPARARRWKRAAIVMASVSTLALVVFVIISFLPKGNDAFSVRIDNPKQAAEEAHFHMAISPETSDQALPSTIRDKSLDSMEQTTAEKVEKYLDSVDLLSGPNYMATYKDAENTVVEKGYALVYTVYLVNDSQTEDQKLKYSVVLDSYHDSDTHKLIDFFRVLIQTEVVGKSGTLANAYYGRRHTNVDTPYPTYKNSLGNDREPISTYLTSWTDLKTFTADFDSNGKTDGYCNSFQEIDDLNNVLINSVEFTIPAGQMLRFTYVAYFEGADMDGGGNMPENSYLLLSLHFGV